MSSFGSTVIFARGASAELAELEAARAAQVEPDAPASPDDTDHDGLAVAAAHDDARRVHIDVQARHLLVCAADGTDGRRGGQVGAEELEQEPADRVAVEPQVACLHLS